MRSRLAEVCVCSGSPSCVAWRWRRIRPSKESRSSIFNFRTASRWTLPTWRVLCLSGKASRCTPSMWRMRLTGYSPPGVLKTSWWKPSHRPQGVIVRFVTKNARFLGGIYRGRQGTGVAQSGPGGQAPRSSPRAPLSMTDDVTEAVDRIHRLLQANGFYEAQSHSDRGTGQMTRANLPQLSHP